MSKSATKRGRRGQRHKSIEEVVSYAVGHRIRVAVLMLLNEGTYTPAEMSAIIEEPLNNVSNHLRELLDAGSVEIAKTETKRNTVQHYYRAVEMPYFSDEDVADMTEGQRQVTAGLIVQGMVAEILGGLWAGKMKNDPRVWIAWRWFHVDKQGREELADRLEACWKDVEQIQVDSINRSAESGEELTSMLVSQTGFERARKAPVPPPESSDDD